jgi:tetratricopeptide (TPR) repeat protein
MAGREDLYQKAMNEGHSAAWDQEWEKAAVLYQSALKEFPNQPKALTSLGLALFELNRFDESLQAYQHAAQVAPQDPVPLEKVGQLEERLGNIPEAVQNFLKVGEIYIKTQDSEKAVENWVRVTQLDSENTLARSYLAMVHERLGHAQQAVTEYIALASLFQRAGNGSKADEMLQHASRLMPGSAEVKQAEAMLKSGQLLPKPMRPQGGTGPLRVARVKQLEPEHAVDEGIDPVGEARRKALNRLAQVLFDLSEEIGSSSLSTKLGMQALVRGTGPLNMKQNDRNKAILHIGQGIDAQTNEQEGQAAEEFEKALGTGFSDPALYFDLGLLVSKSAKPENTLRYLQNAVNHDDYAMASRLLMAQIKRDQKNLPGAVVEYMEALKIADSLVVKPEEADDIKQLYESLIEAQSQQEQAGGMEQLCDNIKQLLMRPDWRAAVRQAREQLPRSDEGMPPVPLAEILTQAQSNQVIEAVGRVRKLARAGYLRTAMDEAFESFRFAPSYLPLHTLVGDLLIQDGRISDAIAKYTVTAQAYSVRGEGGQAVNLLRKIVQVAPMDLSARNRLIDQLTARGQTENALVEYLDLADIHYRLAELDAARKTYTIALQLAQQGGANRAWSVKLLQRMADIDMQRLDWKQALRIYEQLRTLVPEDLTVRRNIIDLNNHLNQKTQATDELNSFITYMDGVGRRAEVIPFLEDFIKEDPKQALLRYTLAEEYRRAGRIEQAVAQLDELGESLLSGGDQAGAIQAIETIISMNPPNQANYLTLLEKLRSGAKL